MFKLSQNIIAGILFVVSIQETAARSPDWGGKKSAISRSSWSINVSQGLTSYFGDLSIYDDNPIKKILYESGPATAATLTKMFPIFGVSGQLLYGNLNGKNNNDISFNARFLEYNLHGRIDFLKIFDKQNRLNFGFIGYAGVGQFIFKATRNIYEEGQQKSYVNNTGTPEFVFFLGTDIFYKINPRLDITADLALRQSQNDKLDNLVKNNNFDYYTFLSMGVSYYFKKILPSLHRKNGNLSQSFVKFKLRKHRKVKPCNRYS
ncbi:MAG: hypothetical protein JW731_05880 [Bacteroidales bacterium]|nr:hypothetical protein [Bacteroidales bacterium]